MISAAKAVVKCLEREGVGTVFGYPGAAICPVYDALIGSKVTHILVRQEQAAGHAASGYARVTGRVGVCLATSGPGATNLLTALASAYMDSVPMVAITGQVPRALIGRDVFQEADITGACEPFIKHSYLVEEAESLPRVMKEAFHIARTGRPGPVLVDIPVDVQESMLNRFEYPAAAHIVGYKPTTVGHAVQIKRALEALGQAKRPVICAGGGVFSAKATELLRLFAEQVDAPVVTTMMGVGALEAGHPLRLGMLGTHGVRAANQALYAADLLVICGARVGDRAVAKTGQVAENAVVIHIDVDPAEIGKNLKTAIPIVGDVGQVLAKMLELGQKLEHPAWCEQCTAWKTNGYGQDIKGFLNPYRFLEKLNGSMRPEGVIVADVGQNQIWSANTFGVPKGRFLTSGGMGTMGYSLPAAIGAKLADPSREVVCVCGDGSFQMSMMELATLCQHNISVKIVIMKNMRLGMIRELQDEKYAHRHTAVFLDGSPDFMKLAEAYGISAACLRENDKAEAAIDEMLGHKGPYLLECSVSPDQPSL